MATGSLEGLAGVERHVYEPHRAGMPPLRPYLRQLRQRREFLFELSRSTLRTQNVDTLLGSLWLVINPLLLGSVYYLLADVLRGGKHPDGYFAHLLAGLFAYYYVTGCMQQGARSIVGSGKLLINTAFPRVLLPLSSTLVAFWRFLPTLLVYAVAHVASGQPVDWQIALGLVSVAQMTVLGAGLAMFFATLQVYVRDTATFLPYLIRITLYLSPVLITVDKFPGWSHPIHPFFYILASWSKSLVYGESVPLTWWLGGWAWALGVFVIGWVFFVSREREFAFRL